MAATLRAFAHSALFALGFVLTVGAAPAATIPVVSYEMTNGHGTGQLGDYNYLDWKYPSPNHISPGQPLSGGTGLLTDGIAPTTGYGLGGDPLAFIGWKYTDPTITFYLSQGFSPGSIVLYLNGVFTGLSGPPGAIEVNNHLVSFTSAIYTCEGCSTQPGDWYNSKLTIDLDPSLFDTTDPNKFEIQLFRGPYVDTENYAALYPNDTAFIENALNANNKYFTDQGLQPWIHLSEVEFLTAVPEPSTWIMMVLGFAGLAAFAHRRQRASSVVA